MSFFDEGDEPSTTIGPPPQRRRPSRPPGAGGAPPDERTVLARRAGAVGIVLVTVILVVLGVKAYLASEARQALENYNANVNTLLSEQYTQVQVPFFNSLKTASGESGNALETFEQSLLTDSVIAKQEASTAAGWSVPGPMVGAQTYLLEVLDFRWQALLQVANNVGPALTTGGSAPALQRIAGAMEMINASDIIYATRVQPLIAQQLAAGGIGVAGTGPGGVVTSGQQVDPSQFLPSESWTLTTYVAGELLGYTPPSLGGTSNGGTNGHALLSVSVGGTQLVGGGTVNPLTYTPGSIFALTFENDGTNTEHDVVTKVTVRSASFAAVSAEATTATTQPSMNYTADITLPGKLPTGTTLQVIATVEQVPGETDLTNNTQTFLVVLS